MKIIDHFALHEFVKITDHFALHEFAQRAGLGVPAQPYPSEWVLSRLQPLCQQLEVIRGAFQDSTVRIISGYRSPAFNARLRGAARKSQHMEGRAADIRIVASAEMPDADVLVIDRTRYVLPELVHDHILFMHSKKTSLFRLGGLGDYPSFTHVDIRPGSKLARWSGSRKDN